MTSTQGTKSPEIRELRADESDEFVALMELAFKESIEEDRLDTDEIRKIMKKFRTLNYKILTRVLGIRMEFYIASKDEMIASGIQLQFEKDEGYVGNIMTHPKFRRQGLARKLLHLTFERARELDISKVKLDARADNVNAVHLYTSEGFETTFHSGRFKLDFVNLINNNASNDLIVHEIKKIDTSIIDEMLDDCYPPPHLDAVGRKQFLKDSIPSRAIRFFARRLAGQLIHTYAFYKEGEDKPLGMIQATQSKIEQQIRLSSPILFEKDNEILMDVIPKVLKIETTYNGMTTASISCSMHRIDAISKIESMGFKKIRENLSMVKRL